MPYWPSPRQRYSGKVMHYTHCAEDLSLEDAMAGHHTGYGYGWYHQVFRKDVGLLSLLMSHDIII